MAVAPEVGQSEHDRKQSRDVVRDSPSTAVGPFEPDGKARQNADHRDRREYSVEPCELPLGMCPPSPVCADDPTPVACEMNADHRD